MKSIYSNLFIDKHGQVKSVRKDGCAFDEPSLNLGRFWTENLELLWILMDGREKNKYTPAR